MTPNIPKAKSIWKKLLAATAGVLLIGGASTATAVWVNVIATSASAADISDRDAIRSMDRSIKSLQKVISETSPTSPKYSDLVKEAQRAVNERNKFTVHVNSKIASMNPLLREKIGAEEWRYHEGLDLTANSKRPGVNLQKLSRQLEHPADLPSEPRM